MVAHKLVTPKVSGSNPSKDDCYHDQKRDNSTTSLLLTSCKRKDLLNKSPDPHSIWESGDIKIHINTMLCLLKVNSNTIKLTLHTSSYSVST